MSYPGPPPNIIGAIKSVRWARLVARVAEKKCIKCFSGKPEGNYRLEDLCVDGTIILK
jgi:hypothetical protein